LTLLNSTSRPRRLVHRLVYRAFSQEPEEGRLVDTKDVIEMELTYPPPVAQYDVDDFNILKDARCALGQIVSCDIMLPDRFVKFIL
jgi:hypothetical protein